MYLLRNNTPINMILKRNVSRKYFSTVFCGLENNKQSTLSVLASKYVPQEVEKYPCRESFFKPPLISSDRFTLILPPPNVTGSLHLGHALTATIQDVLVKWNRMRGIETVWVPGIDHAGIATQVIVEKKLWMERKLTRHDIGREKFINEVWNWKHEKADIINQQLKRLGISADWDRETFTMDRNQSKAVIEAFVQLFESGLVYESDALVNWSCVLRSAISDIEVDHVEIAGPTHFDIPGYKKPIEFGILTKFAYKVEDPADDKEIIVSTTRPETMLGDVAVAVNAKDERYASLVGKFVRHPFRQDVMPIICDDFVDPTFGTGAVKITPAHDPIDFQVAKRHGLPVLSVIDEDGTIKSAWKDVNGMPRFDVRTRILEELRSLGVYRGHEKHSMTVPFCSRSKDVVEFLVKRQWFIKCDGMAHKAANDVREGRLKICPEQFQKNWFDWLENTRDWCVSRQLWWGHKIPIYHCRQKNSSDVYKVAARNIDEATDKARKYLHTSDDLLINQEEDVLDTWFSSALLPFSNFGWPTQADQLNVNYPLSVMETGHDILLFWVARMVMLGSQLTGHLPFHNIILHGVICDGNGRKMSKSLGNVIAPEDVILGRTLQELVESSKNSLATGVLSDLEFEKAVKGQKTTFPDGIPQCGVDALRLTLCSNNIKNHFMNFDIQECNSNKLFGNKLWQATKFALKWCELVSQHQNLDGISSDDFSEIDKWILSRLSHTVDVVNNTLESADFHTAVAALKKCLYYEFCDIYLEASKRGLKDTENKVASVHCWVLVYFLDVSLRCLAPFMPHLCQHLHEQLAFHPVLQQSSLYYPTKLLHKNEPIEKDVQLMLTAVGRIRMLKNIFRVTNKPTVVLITSNNAFKTYANFIQDLAFCSGIAVCESDSDLPDEEFVSDTMTSNVSIHLRMQKEWKKSFNFNGEKMKRKRAKLAIDLEKMGRSMSADGYKLKVSSAEHGRNLKKMTDIQESISRIDYMQTFVNK